MQIMITAFRDGVQTPGILLGIIMEVEDPSVSSGETGPPRAMASTQP